jgi:PAS domain S-box-containing protein
LLECFVDIADRKEMEVALGTSEAKFKEIFETIEDLYYEVDSEGIIKLLSPSVRGLTGWNEEDLIGKPVTTVYVNPNDRERLLSKLSKKGYVHDYELLLKGKDGKERQTSLSAHLIIDHKGRPIGVRGLLRDITKRKQMEKAVEESERQFRQMFEESPIGMVMVGADARYIRANAAFCGMLGYTEEELTSLALKDTAHPDHIADDVLYANDLISGKISFYRTEKRYVRKDKEAIWGSTMVNVMRDRDGRFLYFLTTIEDITERKRSEAERTRLELQLFQAQKMEAIGTLAGGIAHDFNNILTALVGYAGLLKMKLNRGSLHTYVDQILSASQKATDLIQSLLAFSRQQTITLNPVGINSLIKGTEKLLKRLVTEDIIIKTLLSTEDMTIMADATQIDQILFNLATNARDAMPQGGTFTIETKAVDLSIDSRPIHWYGKPGRYTLISVSDTGAGMDDSIRERIFDPFFTTKEVGKGTGLGLSTVYGIVKQHNGYITVYSEPNIGTTFHIHLPIANEAGKEEGLTLTLVEGGKETILVAEDNESVRDLMSEVLTEYGYTVIEAIDGQNAIGQFKETNKIDLLILDSVMPIKNGREVYNEIQKIKPDIRVIFMSGYTRDVFLDKGIEDKKFDFLQKPISPDTLLQKVREVLDNRQDFH